ncbi:MAG: hypothetical protein B6U89_00915 [Desulfurococcales archaeon ex4484_58]|nr:MAG: hypothetical protein B6U89_00915 [Desulfurococcales archaeon ex4484_58]
MNYIPTRILIYYTNNVCSDPFIEALLLYGLLVSRGIRIDTRVYIINDKIIYGLDGYKLRHLHPQRRSLRGFIEKIICSDREAPGFKIYPLSMLPFFTSSSLIITHSFNSYLDHKKLINFRKYILIDKDSLNYLENLIYVNTRDYFSIRERNKLFFIIKSHYILDTIIGGWIRRLGEIKYYSGLQ